MMKINGQEYQAEPGQTVLEIALANGIKIPTLCYHKELRPYGACRVCLVEVVAGGRPGLVASCLCPASDGLEVKTDTERVQRSRRIMFELLLARAPEAEKVKALAAEHGVTQTRFVRDDADNCILCGLCGRVCEEISERHAIDFSGRGSRRTVQTPFGKIAQTCIGCSACAYVCPTKIIEVSEAS